MIASSPAGPERRRRSGGTPRPGPRPLLRLRALGRSIGLDERDPPSMGLVLGMVPFLAAFGAWWAVTVLFDPAPMVPGAMAAVAGLLVLASNAVAVRGISRPRSRSATVMMTAAGTVVSLAVALLVGAAVTTTVFGARIQAETDLAEDHVRAERLQLLRTDEEGLLAAKRELAQTFVHDDPEIRRLQAAYDDLDRQVLQADAGLICEINGRCSTSPGQGRAYDERVQQHRRLIADRDRARDRLDTAVSVAHDREDDIDEEALAAVDAELAAVREQIGRLTTTDPAGGPGTAGGGPTSSLAILLVLLTRPDGGVVSWFAVVLVVLGFILTLPLSLRLLGGSPPRDVPEPRTGGGGSPYGRRPDIPGEARTGRTG